MSIDWLLTAPQYIIPQHLLSAIVRHAARSPSRHWKNVLIHWFARRYNVDLSIAEAPSPSDYPTFNAFFTRALRTGVRAWPDDPRLISSPIDGTVSEIGDIAGDQLIQAKGRSFSLATLLAKDIALTNTFSDASFATLYLAPRDYHRIHMPCAGVIQRIIYVPGDLFSVNARTARVVNSLFARNERVIVLFSTADGPMAVVLVGALFVGSMTTVWTGDITPKRLREVREWNYIDNAGSLSSQRGAELGRFNMGSTVILLFPRERVQWSEELRAGSALTLGQPIASIRPAERGIVDVSPTVSNQ